MGKEILEQMKGREVGEYIFFPPDAVDSQQRMLDDMTIETMSQQLGAPIFHDSPGPLELAAWLSRA